MPARGVLFALEPAEDSHLLAIHEAPARAAWVASVVEERWDVDWLHAIGTLWFPVHFCLHGSSAFPLEGSPAEAKAIFGGIPLGVPKRYSIDYKDRELVRRISNALGHMRDDAVWARASLVERKDYTGPRDRDLQMGVVDEIYALASFYKRADEAARSVIFTVDV